MHFCNCPIIPAVQMPHKGQGDTGPPRLLIGPLNQSKLPKYTSGVELKLQINHMCCVYIVWKVYFYKCVYTIFFIFFCWSAQDLRLQCHVCDLNVTFLLLYCQVNGGKQADPESIIQPIMHLFGVFDSDWSIFCIKLFIYCLWMQCLLRTAAGEITLQYLGTSVSL